MKGLCWFCCRPLENGDSLHLPSVASLDELGTDYPRITESLVITCCDNDSSTHGLKDTNKPTALYRPESHASRAKVSTAEDEAGTGLLGSETATTVAYDSTVYEDVKSIVTANTAKNSSKNNKGCSEKTLPTELRSQSDLSSDVKTAWVQPKFSYSAILKRNLQPESEQLKPQPVSLPQPMETPVRHQW